MATKTIKADKIWAYKIKHPEASIKEISKATKTSYGYVWTLMNKIGTPKEVLEDVSREIIPQEPPVVSPLANRDEILEDARIKINGDRHEEYGDAAENFERIAGYWNAHLGLNGFITPRDVAAMMVLLKISRLHGDGPKDVDTYVDICGYAAIGGEIAGAN